MKLRLFIHKDEDERIEIHARERNELVEQIETLVNNYAVNLNGYKENEIVPLTKDGIYRVFVEDNKVYASTADGTYQLKLRLYQLEEMLGDTFLKINQSALVNKRHIKKFSSSWGGSLLVELTNGETDYISRRQTKHVMERMGIK